MRQSLTIIVATVNQILAIKQSKHQMDNVLWECLDALILISVSINFPFVTVQVHMQLRDWGALEMGWNDIRDQFGSGGC